MGLAIFKLLETLLGTVSESVVSFPLKERFPWEGLDVVDLLKISSLLIVLMAVFELTCSVSGNGSGFV